NQDNGTGRIRSVGGGGLVQSPEHINDWLGRIPTEFKAQINGGNPVQSGRPAGGGSDDFSFGCAGLPAFGLGATPWDYNTVTWHTERDTFDKVVFDDLKYNATLTAMLAYLASEDPTRIPLDRVDLAAQARAAGGAGGGGGGRGFGSTTWPECEKASRKTSPRLK
ncbi:MAG TPA: peptidase M28, partial [Gemmatimonadaceae bacterium]|nr:peptidase M28 [Gemmatimonadaceae bacterium]